MAHIMYITLCMYIHDSFFCVHVCVVHAASVSIVGIALCVRVKGSYYVFNMSVLINDSYYVCVC